MSGPPLYEGNCNYTPSGTAVGTQTLNAGPPNPPGSPGQAANPYGVLYGYHLTSAGTAAMVVSFLDIVMNAAGVSTTNTILTGTASTAGATVQAINGIGIRYRGELLLVTSGTVGAGNSLWD